jgi:hypothetical protein
MVECRNLNSFELQVRLSSRTRYIVMQDSTQVEIHD